MITYPLNVPALKVEQPIGTYYVAILPARVLLDTAFSDALSASLRPGEQSYDLDGTQRLPQPKRLQPIADYIDRVDAAFPNSIILAANYKQEDGLLVEEKEEEESADQMWSITNESDNGSCTLTIPSSAKLASIIDGQHRLFAFAKAKAERLDMKLICSIFLDLPKPFQAQIFAIINSTQKPVDKSLTYEQFGYNLNEESEAYWSPDKLAVFLTRKLAIETISPLRGRIEIAPKKDKKLTELSEGRDWKVSTAVVVEGIMRLYTSNPKKDTTDLLAPPRKTRGEIATLRRDKSPLREVYLKGDDLVLYTMVLNYLSACDELFWAQPRPDSFIIRTVGVQALFDVLRGLALTAYSKRTISSNYFKGVLAPASKLDFSTEEFKKASGSGRSKIRNAIQASIS